MSKSKVKEMNPAFDRTLSLLVEIIGRHHTTPKPTSNNRGLVGGFPTSTVRKPTKRSKRFDPGAEDVKKKMLGGATPSYSRSTDPQEKPSDDTPAEQRIPPSLKKAETFYDKLKAALINNKEKFKAGVRKISAKIRRKK